MPKNREDGSIPADCKDCEHWSSVKDRVRIHSVLTSMAGKIEEKVTADEFKPTVGDFLKVVELERAWDTNEGSKEIVARWADPALVLKS